MIRFISKLIIACAIMTPVAHANNVLLFTSQCQVTGIGKSIAKKAAKKAIKQSIKKTTKKKVAETAAKGAAKSTARTVGKKIASTKIGKEVLAKMTKEQQELFLKKGYRQVKVNFNGKEKPLLVSKEFDPHLKISREYTGDWDPVKFHKGDPRYVVDGCETNLGRMKRGLAPLYKDPTNTNPKWHGYSEFEVHHGGQKADPEYYALMGKEHKSHSDILHTKSRGEKSEINRADFAKKEREPMYKKWAKQLSEELFSSKATLK